MERSPPGHSDARSCANGRRNERRSATVADAGGFEHAQRRFLALATSDDAWFDARASGETAVLLRAEAVRSWELFRTGVIREMNWRSDRHDVVIVLEALDAAAAEAALGTLPLVEAGAISFEVVGLRPYDGWTRLFADPALGTMERGD